LKIEFYFILKNFGFKDLCFYDFDHIWYCLVHTKKQVGHQSEMFDLVPGRGMLKTPSFCLQDMLLIQTEKIFVAVMSSLSTPNRVACVRVSPSKKNLWWDFSSNFK